MGVGVTNITLAVGVGRGVWVGLGVAVGTGVGVGVGVGVAVGTGVGVGVGTGVGVTVGTGVAVGGFGTTSIVAYPVTPATVSSTCWEPNAVELGIENFVSILPSASLASASTDVRTPPTIRVSIRRDGGNPVP